jgi:hypothetical protein
MNFNIYRNSRRPKLTNSTLENLALTEATYTVVRMAQEFKEIRSQDPGPWIESLGVTCSSSNGAKVVLVRE